MQRSLGACVVGGGGVVLLSSAASCHSTKLLQYVDLFPNTGCLLTFWFPDRCYKLVLLSPPPLIPPSLFFPSLSLFPSQPTLLSYPLIHTPQHSIQPAMYIYFLQCTYISTFWCLHCFSCTLTTIQPTVSIYCSLLVLITCFSSLYVYQYCIGLRTFCS